MAEAEAQAKSTSLGADELMDLLRDDGGADECQAGVVTDKVRTVSQQAEVPAYHLCCCACSASLGTGKPVCQAAHSLTSPCLHLHMLGFLHCSSSSSC